MQERIQIGKLGDRNLIISDSLVLYKSAFYLSHDNVNLHYSDRTGIYTVSKFTLNESIIKIYLDEKYSFDSTLRIFCGFPDTHIEYLDAKYYDFDELILFESYFPDIILCHTKFKKIHDFLFKFKIIQNGCIDYRR